MIMDESDPETGSEEGIQELADVYSSSSYSPSTDDVSDSDSDGSRNRFRNTPNQKKIAYLKEVDESGLSGCDGSFEGSVRKYSDEHGTIQKYLDELRNIKGSSDLKNKFLEFCERFEENYYELTPEKLEKVKNLDIEMEDIDDDYDKTLGNPTSPYFTKEEVDIIEENWKCFCEDYGFDPKEDLKVFFFQRHKGPITYKQKKMFKCYLSQHLLNRQLCVVYRKFMEIYSGRRTEKYTREEDELLMTWHEVSVGAVGVSLHFIVSQILQRPFDMLKRRRAFILSNPDHSDEDFSCPFRIERKRPKVPEYLEDILNRQDNEYPDWIMNEEAWKKMADINGQYNVKEIKKAYFQEIYPSVRASTKVRSTLFKRRLIKKLSVLEDLTWETVDWKELGEKCYNVGAVRVYSVMRTLTKKYVPNEKWGDLKAALETIKTVHPNLDSISRSKKFKICSAEFKAVEPLREKIVQGETTILRAQKKTVPPKVRSVCPGSLRICSSEFVPTSDSDTDDHDIVSADAKGPGVPYNNNAKNGAGPKADSHGTDVFVAENLEAVESPKKQIGQREKTKEETHKAENDIAGNEEAQGSEKSDIGEPSDDAAIATHQKAKRAKLNKNEEGNVKTDKKDLKGGRQRKRKTAVNLKWVRKKDGEIEESDSNELDTETESQFVIFRKQNPHKKEDLSVEGHRKSKFIEGWDSENSAEVGTPRKKKHLARGIDHDMTNTPQLDKAECQRNAGGSRVRDSNGKAVVESPKKQIGQREKTKEETHKAENDIAGNEEAQGSEKSDIGEPNDVAAIATHQKSKRAKLNKGEEGNVKTDKKDLKSGRQRKRKTAVNLKWVRKKDGEIEESEGDEPATDIESPVVVCGKRRQRYSDKKENLGSLRKPKFIEVGTPRKKKQLAHDIVHDAMNTPQSDKADCQRHAGGSRVRDSSKKVVVKAQFVTPRRTKSTGGLNTRGFMRLFNRLNGSA